MKKIIIATLLVLLSTVCFAKDFTARATIASWNGLDANGVLEGSLPVTIKLYNATTNLVVSQVNVTGPVTNFVMPDFIVTVPSNATLKVKFYATATDSVGNVSVKGPDSNEITLVGDDTVAPSVINVNITVQ